MEATIAMGFCIERLRFGFGLHYDIWDWKTTILLALLKCVSIPSFTKVTETGNKDDGQSPKTDLAIRSKLEYFVSSP
jgi:hypothetical protein